MFTNFLVAGLALAGTARAQLVMGVSSMSMSMPKRPPCLVARYLVPPRPKPPQHPLLLRAASAPPASSPTDMPSYPSYQYLSDMPYSVMTGGGYKKLDCGYGYVKGSDGSCKPESWYSYTNNGCYAQTTIIIKYVVPSRRRTPVLCYLI
jgi:hypothetical protein